ncbi:MAG: hypothetical protein DGJ47_000272 [Rickettsiaceae bacterium]
MATENTTKSVSFTMKEADQHIAANSSVALEEALPFFKPHKNSDKENKNLVDDINRLGKLYIEKDGGLKDFKEQAKQEQNIDKLEAEHITAQFKKYGLSDQQAEAISSTCYQKSIGGSSFIDNAFSQIVMSSEAEQSHELLKNKMNRNSVFSKMSVNDDGSVTLTGGQKYTFDCPEDRYDGIIKQQLHTELTSKDYITLTISMRVEKDGTYETNFDMAGTGKMSDQILDQFSSIETKQTSKTLEEMDQKYLDLLDAGDLNKATKDEYKKAVLENITTEMNKEQPDMGVIEKLNDLKYGREVLDSNIFNVQKQEQNIAPYFEKDPLCYTRSIIETIVNNVDNDIKKLNLQPNEITDDLKQGFISSNTEKLNRFLKVPEEKLEVLVTKISEARLEHHVHNIEKKNKMGFIAKATAIVKEKAQKLFQPFKYKTSVNKREVKEFAKQLGEALKSIKSDSIKVSDSTPVSNKPKSNMGR